MSEHNSRREFLQSAGLTAAGVMAAAYPGAGVSLEAAAAPAPAKTMGARFRELLQKREPFAAVAAYDVFAARMVEEMGFQAIFMGGSLTGDFYAQPVWLTDLSERLSYVRHIAEHVDIPTLVDFDDGGDPMSVYRYTKEFERAHIGAVHILDDLVGPMGVAIGVIPVNKMVDKIHAAVDARSDVAVTVRCGAASPNREGKDKAIERGVAYAGPGNSEETSIEFALTHPAPVIPAAVNGRPGLFILDTQQDEVVLERDFARRAWLHRGHFW